VDSERRIMSGRKDQNPVLILGAAPRISLAIARSLHHQGISVEVASFQPEEPILRSRAVREFHRLPSRVQGDDAFAAALLALIRKKQFDTILPAGDPALAALAGLYHELSPLLHVGCPPPRTVERVLNKSLTLDAAQQCDIRVPFTCTVASVAELEAVAPQLQFPVVAKPEKKGAATFRIFYFQSLQQLSAALASSAWGNVLLQEYCPGVGVGIEILIHQGECLAKFQHRRLKEAPASGGVAILAVAEEPDPELVRSSMQLLRALEWEGVAMVEYRVDREAGRSALMEVNGRFWGSVSFPVAAGINFPYYYWQVLHGEQPVVPERYRVGMRWRWSPGYFDRMQSIIFRNAARMGPKPSLVRELLLATADFSPLIKEAAWSWSDPFPFFAETGSMLWSSTSALTKAAFRKVAPRKLQSYLGIYSRLTPEARSKYASLRLRDAVGFQAPNGHTTARVAAESTHSVLFVCYGNLMRSPMAETMLRRALAERGVRDVVVKSAGLHAKPGRRAHTWAIAVSRELGMPLDEHRAQPTTSELIASSDLIFAMDYENLAELESLYPDAKDKILMLSRYADGPQRNREIPDPYFGDIETTRRCYSVLSQCTDGFAEQMASARPGKPVSVST
jgi:protein-tyrosine-phosphatase/predicted ATP-grasp superfamily ATP-dependent carboligase